MCVLRSFLCLSGVHEEIERLRREEKVMGKKKGW